jgi:hypothetical protein
MNNKQPQNYRFFTGIAISVVFMTSLSIVGILFYHNVSGQMMNPQTGMMMENKSGMMANPNNGQMMNPQTGMMMENKSGMMANPNNGQMMNK